MTLEYGTSAYLLYKTSTITVQKAATHMAWARRYMGSTLAAHNFSEMKKVVSTDKNVVVMSNQKQLSVSDNRVDYLLNKIADNQS